MKIYNTLTRSVEEFLPLNPPKVTMYTCGPTVYDYMHIGNLRTFVFSDILERSLRFNGYEVLSAQNITDIDDKIIKRAKERNILISELSEEYEGYFFEDIEKLNILPKTFVPKATGYIKKMQDYIKILIDRRVAYVEDDGSVYFDISKFENYGKLSGIDASSLKTGTRILSDEYTKDDVQDFALWKSVDKDEMGYDSPWGWGRPGWHIECSVMSQENLGKTLDIHTGGVDLIFPHHENEIAQSESASGKQFARYFAHGAHMLVDEKKMSKSLNNFYRLEDVEGKGVNPLALRYLYLQTHYRQEMNFTWEALSAAQNALDRLRNEVASWEEAKIGCAEYEEKFLLSVNYDLNMPEALAVLWEMVKSDYPSSAKKRSVLKFDEVLGLSLNVPRKTEKIPQGVLELSKKREGLRGEGKFDEADRLRKEIEEKGFVVEDSESGPRLREKS